MPELRIEAIPAFSDNYIWLLVREGRAAVVDPGDAAPVQRALDQRGLRLDGILVTHHHADHVGGVAVLAADSGAPVYGPATEDIPARTHAVAAGAEFELLGERCTVLEVPGHTRGHLAYLLPALPALFCGDTLFGAGCGRLFEGTPAQMADSLARLAALPADTRVYCAHEYTLSNLRFAAEVEPGNAQIDARRADCEAQRRRGEPTLPSTLADELATNPFLRCAEPAVRATAERRLPGAGRSTVDTFAVLRDWKNRY
jgi:hydroxyacylglutathione hydrolase